MSFMVILGGLVAGLAAWAVVLAVRPSPVGPVVGADLRAPALRAQRAGQVALGGIWLVDGLLQLQPYMFTDSFVSATIVPVATGQPGVVAHSVRLVAGWIEPVVVPFNAVAVATQLIIGIGLMRRRWVRAALAASFSWSLAVWWVGEGFGGLLTGGSSPLTGAPGAVALYALAGLIVWPAAEARTGRSAAAVGVLGDRRANWAWSGLWLLFAGLWLLPANRGAQSVHDAVSDASTGIAGLDAVERFIADGATGHGEVIALAAAALSVGIAAAPLVVGLRRSALILAIAAGGVLWIGEGFGGLFTGSATDPNSGPLVILIALLLLPVPAVARGAPAQLVGEGFIRRGPLASRAADRLPASFFSTRIQQRR
jgi:hypothetical protein